MSADARLAAFKNAIASRYLIDDEVGRGGMAIVYVAREVRLGRRVALKVLAPPVATPSAVEAFLREISRTVRLEHPNMLPFLDAGKADGLPFYVMRYVRGGSLRQRLARRRHLALAETATIVRQTAAALQFAHEHRILHCDVKPENILLEGDHVYLADFGVARAVHADALGWKEVAGLDSGGGTPEYASPEQVFGDRMLDGRTDLYSLACVTYEMLAGRSPFTGRTGRNVMARRLINPAAELHQLPVALPAASRAEIARALSAEPEDRHRSVADFAAALDESIARTVARHPERRDAANLIGRVRRMIGLLGRAG